MVFFNNTRLFLPSLICCLALLCLSSGFQTPESVTSSKAKQEFGIFRKWMKKHGKTYPNPKEIETRFQIFQRNLKYITEMNLKRSNSSSGHRLGLNRFSDMSSEEFKEVYLHEQKMPTSNKTAAATAISSSDCAAPANMDWRSQGVVTPVKYQGSCGCCWAFASAGAMESINAITNGELISLSEQELLDCDSGSRGCSGGWAHSAFEWVINNGGISEETSYPYEYQKRSCRANMQNGGRVVKINSYSQIAQSDEALKCAVAKQPIVAYLYVTQEFTSYSSGIYKGENCPTDPSNINHAVLIVGYNSQDGIDYWIVKNSWGESWGLNGYFYIQRNTGSQYGVCSINAWGISPII